MRERIVRYLAALVAALITTWTGFQNFALADARECSLNDVSAWQMALEDPQEEVSPDYIRRITEAFIEACPNRPEIAEAHRLSAMAAGWEGLSEEAAAHFDEAGYTSDVETLFMHAGIRLALGENARAWALRDEAIEYWLTRLVRRGIADIDIESVQNGELIHVRFRRLDAETRQTHLWLAKPQGAGWPAALSVTSGRQLNAVHKLTAGESAPDLYFVRMNRCKTRRLLAKTSVALSEDDVEEAARLSLSAYLANPDVPAYGELDPCYLADHMLPEVSAATSVAIQ